MSGYELAAVLLFVLSMVALITVVVWTMMHLDRLVVAVMRGFNIRLYPTAIAIATLIEKCPEQWTGSGGHFLCHPDVGAIRNDAGVEGIYVETRFGKWKPNAIERRIIRDAVDWRMGLYIRNRVQKAMERKAIG